MTDVVLGCVVALFVPGHRPERFEKAAAAQPDMVVLDLEDAVPVDSKEVARSALRTDFGAVPVMVRINAVATPWHTGDIECVRQIRPAAVLLPKAETIETIDAISTALGSAIPIVALIETAAGLAAARSIAAHPQVRRLAFGSVDFCADMGCAHLREVLLPARSELVLASRLAGLHAPLDGVTTTIADEAMAAEDAKHARSLGFGGKLAVHPRQIAAIREGFSPEAEEVDWAERVLASGDGAVVIDGAMVDEPVRIRARAILARNKRHLSVA